MRLVRYGDDQIEGHHIGGQSEISFKRYEVSQIGGFSCMSECGQI